MILSDFCDERGHVHTPAKITGVRALFIGGVPPPELWAEMRAQILVSRRYMVVDETLVDLHDFTFHNPFVLLPGMAFEVSVDPEARDFVRFEFDGAVLSPAECLKYVELMGKEKT